ncbi:MAG: NAD(P)/FAD-dependent oxidoreductase [Myxococcota bacterium]|nr:NAD(P)/FAD-dependent oxidoreductase [Myxococcota bacterium]
MQDNSTKAQVLIIGAGAAGMMCGIEAARRGQEVLILEQAAGPGRKIRISGGGRCNFTNIYTSPDCFISENPHFAKSALSRYRPEDFIAWVEKEGITYHEKKLGQLFCDDSAQQIVSMLSNACEEAGVSIELNTAVRFVDREDENFVVRSNREEYKAQRLVVACGGPSIPKMGSSRLGYKIADHFGVPVVNPQAALVPLTFEGAVGESMAALSGLSCEALVRCGKQSFREAILFTHRGLSGPAILQISSYWNLGEEIMIDLLPDQDIASLLAEEREERPKLQIDNFLSQHLPKRLAKAICVEEKLSGNLAEFGKAKNAALAKRVHQWQLLPSGSEGMRTAEVTRGGVDTDALDAKTFEVKNIPGLYFIGEAVDVTGHLGGYNFQWAWASGYVCGQAV